MDTAVVKSISKKVAKGKASAKRHPGGLYVLFMTEFWERFSYYGMRAIFVLFMTDQLLLAKSHASNIYGSYTGLAYLTPIIGGYIADRYWGSRKSIFVGGSLMALGQFILFACASMGSESGFRFVLLWTGLVFLFTGNGFFKPNISAMVGQLYDDQEHTLKDSAYTLFYMGINAGAFLAPLVCGYLGEYINFKWGFLAAGVGMLISLGIFYFTKDRYLITPDGEPIGNSVQTGNSAGSEKYENDAGGVITSKDVSAFRSLHLLLFFVAVLALSGVLFFLLDVDALGAFIYSMTLLVPFTILTDRSLSKIEQTRLAVIVIILLFVVFFWMCFEQAGASLTFFAKEQTNRIVFGWEIPASYFQSLGPVFVVLLAPVFAFLWRRLGRNGIEPPAPRKQAFGLGFLSLGFLLVAVGTPVSLGIKVSLFWLTGLYFLHSVGELLLSPIGLSMVNKLSPKRFTSLMMGLWFLATATGNKLAGSLSALYPDPCPNCAKPVFLGIIINDLQTYFMVFVVLSGIAAVVLYLLSFQLSKMMK
jgi:proton-dependent oligopeptide transporter, POT family